MTPYVIKQAVLTKYSGKQLLMKVEAGIITIPRKIVEERILDTICKSYNNPYDPFVSVKLVTKSI